MSTPEQLNPAGLKAALAAAKEHAAHGYPQTHRTDSSVSTVFGIALTELLAAAIPAYNAAVTPVLDEGAITAISMAEAERVANGEGIALRPMVHRVVSAYQATAHAAPQELEADHLETIEEWSVEVPTSFGSSEAGFDTKENAVAAWKDNQPALLKHTTTVYYVPASAQAEAEDGNDK